MTSPKRLWEPINRGESRHELARWIFFANRGEFRTGDYEEIMNKASWNATYGKSRLALQSAMRYRDRR